MCGGGEGGYRARMFLSCERALQDRTTDVLDRTRGQVFTQVSMGSAWISRANSMLGNHSIGHLDETHYYDCI